jgi:hypothetical protein
MIPFIYILFSKCRIRYYDRLEDDGSARSFQHFLDQLAGHRDRADLQKSILITDNGRFHHNIFVIET